MSNKYIDLIDMLCPNILVMCENQEDYNETVAAFIKSYKSFLTSRLMCTDVQVGYNSMMIDGFTSHEFDKNSIKFLIQNAQITFDFQLEPVGFYTRIIFTDKCKSETINLAKNHYSKVTSYNRLVWKTDDARFKVRPIDEFDLDPKKLAVLTVREDIARATSENPVSAAQAIDIAFGDQK